MSFKITCIDVYLFVDKFANIIDTNYCYVYMVYLPDKKDQVFITIKISETGRLMMVSKRRRYENKRIDLEIVFRVHRSGGLPY